MTATWLDTCPHQRAVAIVERTLPANRVGSRFIAAEADGDCRFGIWLLLCDNRLRTHGMGLAALPRPAWRDLYEGGESPRDAVSMSIMLAGGRG